MCKEVHILLLTPPSSRLPPHRPYIALRGVPMLTEVFDHLIHLLAIPKSNHIRNILYVPCKSRPLDLVVRMVATMNVRMDQWAVLVGMTQHMCDNKVVISSLKKDMSKAIADRGDLEVDRNLRAHVSV